MKFLINKLLSKPYLWIFFRKVMNSIFGIYDRRLEVMKKNKIGDCNSILDIGCGTGTYSIIAKNFYTGIDININYINFAKSRNKNKKIKYICKDVTEIKLSKSFDQILMVGILHHLDRKSILRLLDSLKSEAKIYIFEPLRDQDHFISKLLVKLDRGEFIRTQGDYSNIIKEKLLISKIEQIQLGVIKTVMYECNYKH